MNINDENDKNLLLNDEDNSLTENATSDDELISNNEIIEQNLLNDTEDTLLNEDEIDKRPSSISISKSFLFFPGIASSISKCVSNSFIFTAGTEKVCLS